MGFAALHFTTKASPVWALVSRALYAMKSTSLFKYRALEPFRNLVDTLLKRRLYAAPYFDLNDPMEGRYIAAADGSIDKDIERLIRGNKEKIRICSLSRKSVIDLMWAHYANGSRGLVLEVGIPDHYDLRPVNYGGPAKVSVNMLNPTTAQDVLSNKLAAWEYEEEERVFLEGSHFVDIELRSIIVGTRMSSQDFSLLSGLAEKVCPDVPLRRA